jgi:hypothetical protein
MNKADLNVTLMKAEKKGPGSRGGKIAYYTKGNKPVYESQVKKTARSADLMMQNWHDNAQRSNDPEHHAVAAKQALHAAFFHHHAGDGIASHQAMDYANHHRAAYEKVNHKSRTTNAVDKLHHETAHTISHRGWEPEEHGLDPAHTIAKDAQLEGRHKEAEEAREQAGKRENRGGHVIGKTQTGKPVHGPSKKVIDASARYLKERSKHVGGQVPEEDFERHNKVLHDHIAATSKDYTHQDHEDAAKIHSNSDSGLDTAVHGAIAVRHRANSHRLQGRFVSNDMVSPYVNDQAGYNRNSGLSHADTANNASRAARDASSHASSSNHHQDHFSREAHTSAGEAHEHAAAMHRAAGNHDIAHSHSEEALHHKKLAAEKLKKAITPSNSIGGNMSKNEVSDLFKSELGESNAKPITTCVHCKHDLSRDDLKKGLGTSFVADDNDNPSSGGSGQVEPSRGAPGVKENDEIAPLLKGLKADEYPINKSEMLTMGMNADGLEDGWYKISKSEVMKQAPEHLAYLVDRKERVAKALKPMVESIKKSTTSGDEVRKGDSPRSTTDGPHGYSPRAGGAHGPAGEQLVSWSSGSDAEVAKYIEKSGGYGPGTDESIKTQGRGY